MLAISAADIATKLAPTDTALDPSPRLEAAFHRIQAEQMADVPILNPALRVEALGFARWEGHWLGVLITPWFMNLVLAPGDAPGWRGAADGERVFHRFPAGDYAFLGSREPEVGEFQSCALFSPMDRFPDQATARAVAVAALAALRKPADRKEAAPLAGAAGPDPGTAPLRKGPVRPARSRREFLAGVFQRR